MYGHQAPPQKEPKYFHIHAEVSKHLEMNSQKRLTDPVLIGAVSLIFNGPMENLGLNPGELVSKVCSVTNIHLRNKLFG